VGETGRVTDTVLDAVLGSAIDLARSAVLEVAPPDQVGDHVESVVDDDLVVTHLFECRWTAYRGWRWAATLARTPESEDITVDEVVLLPGPASLLAPEWLPWDERVRAGDLGPGDLHPTALDDPRLEPGFFGGDALEVLDEVASEAGTLRPEQWQIGLGREVVLSAYGRGLAADRWYDGEFGPDAPMAKAAPGHCRSCGYLMPIGGLVGQAFGVCTNVLGADGRVVAFGYGCGAHSSVRALEGTGVPVTDIAVDDAAVELVDLRAVPALDDLADDLGDAARARVPAGGAAHRELSDDVDDTFTDPSTARDAGDEGQTPVEPVDDDPSVDDEHVDGAPRDLLLDVAVVESEPRDEADVDDIDDAEVDDDDEDDEDDDHEDDDDEDDEDDDEDDEDDEDDDHEDDDEDDEIDDVPLGLVRVADLDDVDDLEPDEIL
jgi:hypothetical protein